MFNSYNYKTESKVVAVTKEIEKTITPDKVTEMYDKVKDEVEKSFVRAFRIETDILNGIVVEFADKLDTMQRMTYTRFILNGKEYIAKDIHRSFEALSDGELYEVFSKHLRSEISNQIIKVAAVQLIK
jgi:hypothetical protein